ERLALLVAWRVIVEVVQAALADRDHVVVVEKRNDGVDTVLGFVWVKARGGEDAVVRGGDGDGLCSRCRVATDVDHRRDAGGKRGVDDVVDGDAARVVQMTVAVGVARHGHTVLRGNSASPLVTVRSPG